jgi:hypothetical protein
MNSFGTRALTIAALVLGGAISAHAFDAQQFAPAVDPQGYYSFYSSKTAPRHSYSVAGWYSWAMDPVDDVVDDIHQLNIVGSYSVLDDIEVGIDLPLSMVESDFPGVDDGFGIDDLKLFGKWSAIDDGHDSLGLALIPFVEVPTGDEECLTSNGDVDWGFLGDGQDLGEIPCLAQHGVADQRQALRRKRRERRGPVPDWASATSSAGRREPSPARGEEIAASSAVLR